MVAAEPRPQGGGARTWPGRPRGGRGLGCTHPASAPPMCPPPRAYTIRLVSVRGPRGRESPFPLGNLTVFVSSHRRAIPENDGRKPGSSHVTGTRSEFQGRRALPSSGQERDPTPTEGRSSRDLPAATQRGRARSPRPRRPVCVPDAGHGRPLLRAGRSRSSPAAPVRGGVRGGGGEPCWSQGRGPQPSQRAGPPACSRGGDRPRGLTGSGGGRPPRRRQAPSRCSRPAANGEPLTRLSHGVHDERCPPAGEEGRSQHAPQGKPSSSPLTATHVSPLKVCPERIHASEPDTTRCFKASDSDA